MLEHNKFTAEDARFHALNREQYELDSIPNILNNILSNIKDTAIKGRFKYYTESDFYNLHTKTKKMLVQELRNRGFTVKNDDYSVHW